MAYMLAYTLMGAATVIALYLLIRVRKSEVEGERTSSLNNLVYVGLSLITIGMLFGALSGLMRRGATIGLGTLRRRGQPSPGSPIWYTSITDSYQPKGTEAAPYGY